MGKILLKSISGVIAIALSTAIAWGGDAGSSLTQALDLHQHTNYNASLALLNPHTSDAATNFLIGQNYFMLADFKQAQAFLQKATEEAPSNAEYADWLGRAYGRRAEVSNPLMAPGLASKARQSFEKAVSLDPKNTDAMSDLFDFYLQAPGFLGGGYDKAADIARKMASVDPAEGYFEQARLAQQRKEFDRAETHLREAVAATPKKAGALLVYARFLSKQGRTNESDAVLAQAQRVEPDAPQVWYTTADLLIQQGRDLPQAKTLLERYMHATITVDDPPKYDAQRLLKQVGGV